MQSDWLTEIKTADSAQRSIVTRPFSRMGGIWARDNAQERVELDCLQMIADKHESGMGKKQGSYEELEREVVLGRLTHMEESASI